MIQTRLKIVAKSFETTNHFHRRLHREVYSLSTEKGTILITDDVHIQIDLHNSDFFFYYYCLHCR